MRAFLAVLIATIAAAAAAQDSRLIVTHGGARLELPVTSIKARRDAGVVKQRYDYSCGSAALATLLTYAWNDPADERSLLRALLESLSAEQQAALEKKGLSLFHLQQLAQQRGYKAQGFRVHASQVPRISRPVIVFIKPRGYEHFAVLKGVQGDRVYLADPSLGSIRMPLYRFLEIWADASGHGVLFAVEKPSAQWPERYALQLARDPGPPLEMQTAARLLDIGTPLPSTNPQP